MNNEKTPATGAQYARLGLTISNGVISTIDGHFSLEEMQQILGNEKLIESATAEVVAKLLGIEIDPWASEKKKIDRFYKSNFNFIIDWTKVKLPAFDKDYPRLEYVHADFNCKRYITAYKKKFSDNSVAGNSYSQNPDSAIDEQQEHPKWNYCFSWKGTIEPDAEHLNKSYNDFANDGNSYMIPKEGIISAFRERFETGNMLDVKGLTRFHALDSYGYALFMHRNVNGQFYVSGGSRDFRNSDYGPRQVRF